jgi:hypothetical protein
MDSASFAFLLRFTDYLKWICGILVLFKAVILFVSYRFKPISNLHPGNPEAVSPVP